MMRIMRNIMRMLRKDKQHCSHRGYLLLLSVLISSILLAIALGTVSIVNKGLILSSAGRESQFAFYASDGGTECALYWDLKHTGFSSTVFATSTDSFPPRSGVLCNNQDIAASWTIFDVTFDSAKTLFDLTLSNETCVSVLVLKSGGGFVTTLESRGYNTCDLSNPRRIERAIRVSY